MLRSCSAASAAGAPRIWRRRSSPASRPGLYARGIRRFVISGGETSGAVLEALEVEALEVDSYVTAGQSHSMTTGGDPVSFYLKSGKLGPVEMLETVTR